MADNEPAAFVLRDALAKVASSTNSVSILGASMIDNVVTVDHLPGAGETVASGPIQLYGGGKSANQAAAAARIGTTVQLFGAVGSDANADLIITLLQEAGVNTSHLKHVRGASGSTMIAVDRKGENWVITQAGANAEIDLNYLNSISETMLAASVLGLCIEIPLQTDIAAARSAHDHGLQVWLNNSPFITDIPNSLRSACDGLIVNEYEMALMLSLGTAADENWNEFDWSVAAQRFKDYGFEQAIVTLGAHGSIVLNRGTITRIQPVEIQAADTTGCGDSFFAAVLAGLAADLSLEDSARMASYVSGYAATGMGAQASYGTADQILTMTQS